MSRSFVRNPVCAGRRGFCSLALVLVGLCGGGTRLNAAAGALLAGSFNSIPSGTVVNLSSEGRLDWVHWGLLDATSVDRKAGVLPQISEFTLLSARPSSSFAYWFGDNANGYAWSDGTPTPAEPDTTTGVW